MDGARPDDERNPALSAFTLALLVVWPVVVASMALIYADARQSERLRALEDRPRLAVIDVARFVERAAPGGTDAERVARGLRAAMDASKKLEAAGFVVVDRGSVHAMPPSAEVPVP